LSGAELSSDNSWSGAERRRYLDPQYAGPERRLIGV
jgi:hypothetical protein